MSKTVEIMVKEMTADGTMTEREIKEMFLEEQFDGEVEFGMHYNEYIKLIYNERFLAE